MRGNFSLTFLLKAIQISQHPLSNNPSFSTDVNATSTVCCAVPFLVLSCVLLFVTPWTVARQAPLSMGFSRQEYWSGLPCPPPGIIPNPGIKSMADSLQPVAPQSMTLSRDRVFPEGIKLTGGRWSGS